MALFSFSSWCLLLLIIYNIYFAPPNAGANTWGGGEGGDAHTKKEKKEEKKGKRKKKKQELQEVLKFQLRYFET